NLLSSGRTGVEQVWPAMVAAATYPLYLYCNFSGYIDIVIGIARLLGISLPENFNRPFASDNFVTFWSRWHITLSTWLKTYVYICVCWVEPGPTRLLCTIPSSNRTRGGLYRNLFWIVCCSRLLRSRSRVALCISVWEPSPRAISRRTNKLGHCARSYRRRRGD